MWKRGAGQSVLNHFSPTDRQNMDNFADSQDPDQMVHVSIVYQSEMASEEQSCLDLHYLLFFLFLKRTTLFKKTKCICPNFKSEDLRIHFRISVINWLM